MKILTLTILLVVAVSGIMSMKLMDKTDAVALEKEEEREVDREIEGPAVAMFERGSRSRGSRKGGSSKGGRKGGRKGGSKGGKGRGDGDRGRGDGGSSIDWGQIATNVGTAGVESLVDHGLEHLLNKIDPDTDAGTDENLDYY